jgi:hypothetical protein
VVIEVSGFSSTDRTASRETDDKKYPLHPLHPLTKKFECQKYILRQAKRQLTEGPRFSAVWHIRECNWEKVGRKKEGANVSSLLRLTTRNS